MSNIRITTDELKRLVAQQDLKEFVCPTCGHGIISVSMDVRHYVTFVKGVATASDACDPQDQTLYISCKNCQWGQEWLEDNEHVATALDNAAFAAVKARYVNGR